MSPLAAEILDDLHGPLNGATTVAQLVEWLGEPAVDIDSALTELRLAGLVASCRREFTLAATRRCALTGTHKDLILARLGRGSATWSDLKAAMNSTGGGGNISRILTQLMADGVVERTEGAPRYAVYRLAKRSIAE